MRWKTFAKTKGDDAMKHYLVETYHGPTVYVERDSSWAIATPWGPPEIFAGSMPPSCHHRSRPITSEESAEILGETFSLLVETTTTVN
jgi:hypothetical protein